MPLNCGEGKGDSLAGRTSRNTARIARTARKVLNFQGFRAGGTIMGYRPPVDRYRAPRQVPTAYRPPRNVVFCKSFSAFGLSRSVRSVFRY